MRHQHFNIDERESIFKYLALGFKKSEIARRLGKNRSSIGREIERNSIDGKYSPHKAQKLYWNGNTFLDNFFKVIHPVFCWSMVPQRRMDSVIVKPVHII